MGTKPRFESKKNSLRDPSTPPNLASRGYTLSDLTLTKPI